MRHADGRRFPAHLRRRAFCLLCRCRALRRAGRRRPGRGVERAGRNRGEQATMKLNGKQRDRLVEILRNVATSCRDARTGVWDQSDEGFDAMEMAAEEGLEILVRPSHRLRRTGAATVRTQQQLDDFTRAYIEAVLVEQQRDSTPRRGGTARCQLRYRRHRPRLPGASDRRLPAFPRGKRGRSCPLRSSAMERCRIGWA